MSSYKNLILLNININNNILKGTFTYKIVNKEQKIFNIIPVTKILFNNSQILRIIYDKVNSKIKIICLGKNNDFESFKYINGFNLLNLKIE